MSDVLVALSPGDLQATQASLVATLEGKIKVLQAESDELHEHLLIAQANGWKLSSLRNRINLTARRITYYEKICQAVEAGYLIVPNMPADVVAVRVKREAQPRATSTSSWETFQAVPQLLPAGEGRYVDDRLFRTVESHKVSDGKGGFVEKPLYVSGDYDEPDFPMLLTKPVVMDATAKAMALRLFDEIGIVRDENNGSFVRARKGDPIMVGRIRDPKPNGGVVTFFIAWWLDPSVL